MNCDEASRYSFSLYNRHIQFLDTINDNNRSDALQQIIDRTITNDKKIKLKLEIDRTIQFSMYGAILLILSYSLSSPFNFISVVVGTCILSYGLFGGVRYAVSRTRDNR